MTESTQPPGDTSPQMPDAHPSPVSGALPDTGALLDSSSSDCNVEAGRVFETSYEFETGYASEQEWEAEMAALSLRVAAMEKNWAPMTGDAVVVPDDPPHDEEGDTFLAAAVFVDPNGVCELGLTRAGMLDELIAVEKAEAALHARRTVLLNKYRRFSIDAAAIPAARAAAGVAPMPGAPSEKSGWNTEVIARREMVTEVATATRKAEASVGQLFTEAEMLMSSLPATMKALAEGQISYRHASVVASQATDVPEEKRGEFEEQVVPVGVQATVPRLKQRARIVRERMHPETIEKRKKKAVRGRFVEVDPAADGMAFLTAKLCAVDAVAILNRCTDTAIRLQGPDEERSLGELRADTLRDLLVDGEIPLDSPARTADSGEVLAGAAATGVRATVVVMVPALTLLDRGDEPATLEGYGPIDLQTAKLLAAGADSWIRVLTHPETGTVLSVGQTRYKVPAAMRLWLRLRDLICRFPGCNRSAKHCDLDHILDWQYGGHTSTDNLQHLCPSHHNVKGYTGWKVKHLENGILEWVSPAGRSHITEPAIPIGFTATATDATDATDATVTGATEADTPDSTSATVSPVFGFTEAWARMEADTDDSGWYVAPTDDPTPF